MNLKHIIVEKLLELGGLTLCKPIRLKSGLTSHIYIDARVLLSDPVARKAVVEALASIALSLGEVFEGVAGVATAGIPWATLLAEHLGVAAGYVRPERKKHGLGKVVEGLVGVRKVIVVDDVVTTGSSILEAVESLVAEGYQVVAAVAIVDRCMGGRENLETHGVTLKTVMDILEVLDYARAYGIDVSCVETEVKMLKCR